ncbi:uncharacterized protein LOC135817980 [Sycon ciliatum]|uniref:uncharacterized protein LOC135817980 n=1 Tax=Sycon ciliatum TaxID=27933 RepID=UPI0031F6DCD6
MDMAKKTTLAALLLAICLAAAGITPACSAVQRQCSVLVYGSTPAGLCSAIAASRQLKGTTQHDRVCLLSSHAHIGGMVTGGLGKTDTGGSRGEALIGGIAAEFFLEVGRLYGHTQPTYYFEPSVASKAFANLLNASNVTVEVSELLTKVTMGSAGSTGHKRISSITSSSGTVYSSDVFIDATYEGDLMAMSGVRYTYGREAVSQYNESLAGRQLYSPSNQFYTAVDPIDHATNKTLNFVYSGDPGKPGDADKKVGAYNLRLCLTTNATNKVEISEPEGYNPEDWELVRRYAQTDMVNSNPKVYHFLGIGSVPNGKSDTNNAGPMSTDLIGGSWAYPDADWTERKAIIRQHYLYTHQLLWFLGHDPAINASIRANMLDYGLCADEHLVNEWYEPHWPAQLYVREARRMLGPFVFTEHSARDGDSTKRNESSIGCGSYNFDAHNSQRYPCLPDSIECLKSSGGRINPCCKHKNPGGATTAEFAVIDEGDVEVNPGPFEIPYDVLLPSVEEASNLLVPGAVSSSHVGFSCLRLEPQWMIMGHSSGTAAALALKTKSESVQSLDRSLLHTELMKENQILDTEK